MLEHLEDEQVGSTRAYIGLEHWVTLHHMPFNHLSFSHVLISLARRFSTCYQLRGFVRCGPANSEKVVSSSPQKKQLIARHSFEKNEVH